MARFAYLAGRWVGQGQAHEAGQARDFAQTETVSAHLDGELLTVEGIGHDLHDPGRRTHLAFAVLGYDIDRRQYRWHAYSAGQWTDTEFRLTPDGFTWSLDANPQTIIRYTARVEGDQWHEIGEISTLGADWSTIMTMTMTLHRQT